MSHLRRRVALIAVVLAALAAAPLVGRAATSTTTSTTTWQARPATYTVAIQHNVPIRMSDGIVLMADIYRPADANKHPVAGRFPVLLTQTPYNKSAPQLNFATPYLVSRGYVQVVVDVRGTGASEGQWNSFGQREQRDGYELVRWCASSDRSWSNGRVALHGTSYGAINQLFTAAQNPPGLVAEFPIVPMGDAYRDITMSGGEINTSFIPLWLGLVTGTGLAPSSVSSDPAEAAQALADHARGAATFQSTTVAKSSLGTDQAYDGPFWRTRSPLDVINKVHVPTFVVGGLFDLFQRGEPMVFSALQANHVPSRLLLGPWYHITAGNGLPSQGVPTLDELELRWDDHYVRGVPDPGLNTDVSPVTYYEIGSQTWRHTSSWPGPDVHYTAYNLGGNATPGRPGALGVTHPTGSDSLPWVAATGACSRGTVQWDAGATQGICEKHSEPSDSYGLSYDLPVQQQALHLFGPMTAQLYVSSNGHDADVTARVEDVAPTGKAEQLTAGWQIVSMRALDRTKSTYRDGLLAQPWHPYTRASVLPVKSGDVMEVDVEIFPTGAAILPGHHLRLTLQPADEPHLTPTLPQAAHSAGAVLTFWHDAKHTSRLIVPVRAL